MTRRGVSNHSRETGLDRSAENHYPCMTFDQLAALEFPATDCVLFVWSLVAKLDNAMSLIRGWGFTDKSAHGWAKPTLGTGYWVRDNLELLLIATRGNLLPPLPVSSFPP